MPEAMCGFQDGPNGSGEQLLTTIGPTLGVRIGFDQNYRTGGNAQPVLPEAQHPALVDTGATESCIDSSLAALLHLPIVDRKPLSGAHGQDEVNMHLAQIYVPSLSWVIVGQFAGVHLRAGGQPHFALIGRTFLRSFTMIYNGRTGSVTLTAQ